MKSTDEEPATVFSREPSCIDFTVQSAGRQPQTLAQSFPNHAVYKIQVQVTVRPPPPASELSLLNLDEPLQQGGSWMPGLWKQQNKRRQKGASIPQGFQRQTLSDTIEEISAGFIRLAVAIPNTKVAQIFFWIHSLSPPPTKKAEYPSTVLRNKRGFHFWKLSRQPLTWDFCKKEPGLIRKPPAHLVCTLTLHIKLPWSQN